MKKTYTSEQMRLWGQTNIVAGCAVITAVHMIMLLLGATPFDWVWQGVLLLVLVPVGYLYYRQYKQTKVKEDDSLVTM
jgi:uncharacterized membrane protein